MALASSYQLTHYELYCSLRANFNFKLLFHSELSRLNYCLDLKDLLPLIS
jgi:hypothetical protein